MSSFNSFKHQLDSALDLLESSEHVKQLSLPQVLGAQMVDTESLLNRCDQICEKHKKEKPTIRVIQHFACSGGTLISKCISAMPNVYLLSEVHPYTDLGIGKGKPKYAPTDIISLTKYAGIPNQRELASKLFRQSITKVNQHVEGVGGILVLRDHTHADYCTGVEIPTKSPLIELLEEDYDVIKVATIRDPIDSYSSLVKNGWVHFEPQTFNEYCRRLLLFLESYNLENLFKYEEFVENPQEQSRKISKALELPFSEEFEDIFGMFTVTGDSGRSSETIS
ncbi:hypothetical protein, partial [Vibrio parahaemolyticus]|uniref:hypothetical protein n=1 Tax=Vibrio parahaemolyticus TaxID=670 RepID=UPI003AADE866